MTSDRFHVPALSQGVRELEITSNDLQTVRKMGLRRAPLAFTEHGALMAPFVLNTPRAVKVIRGKACGLTVRRSASPQELAMNWR